MIDKLQASRFEMKYIISEETAQQVREFVRAYLELDENGVGKPNYSYPVHSLYLDSDDLKTYWSTINGDKNRFKLRLRFYNSHADSPVFFEIKRRMNNCILKQRGAVRRDCVDALLAGQLPQRDHLIARDDGSGLQSKHLMALENFCRLMSQIQAGPKVHIAYHREAFECRAEHRAR